MKQVTSAEPRSAEWLAARREGIGASDIAAVFGESPWVTPRQLWEAKLGIGETKAESQAIKVGTALEPVIVDLFREQTHEYMATWPDIASIYADDDDDVCRASFDALDGSGFPVEIKATSHHWTRLPIQYEYQAMWQAGIARAPYTRVVALSGTSLQTVVVEHDPDWFDWARIEAREWWNRHILRGVPPAPAVGDDMNSMFEPEVGAEVEVDPDLWDQYLDARAREAQASDERAELEVALKAALGSATVGTCRGVRVVTWSPVKGRRALDRKALEAAHPELVEQFMVVGSPSRALRVSPTST